MPVEIEMLFCPSCASECLAEAPPCQDGHDDCPDRACVECGTALVLDVGLYDIAMYRSASRPRRSHRRGAA